MNFKKTIATAAVSALAATAIAVSASAETAGLVFQTNAWTFRNTIYQSQAIYWDADFGDATPFDTWNVNDAEITADGTYTVSFEKNVMEDCKDGPESFWNALKLQTNIDADVYPDVQITIDSLKVDGKELAAAKDATLGTYGTSPDDYSDIDGPSVTNAYLVGFYNTWNPDETVITSEDFGGKVECTFTISGFKAAASAEAAEPAAAAEAAEPATGNTNAAATADKSNADTGVEGVAAIAGIAIIAAGAIVIAKKRK